MKQTARRCKLNRLNEQEYLHIAATPACREQEGGAVWSETAAGRAVLSLPRPVLVVSFHGAFGL
jgi:hypothetical protein